jgi:hypothetical protein
MSAVLDLLADLAQIGARLEPADDRLILRAGTTAIPASLVSRIREAKADILATLEIHKHSVVDRRAHDADRGGNSPSDRVTVRIFEASIVEWLNRHPAPSAPGRCAWCGKAETANAVVLPFGTRPGAHTWLHSECWSAWRLSREADAIVALNAMDLELARSGNDHDR